MRNNFRQGIITYPSAGSNQTFLVATGGSVSLRAGVSRVDIAFAQGGSNYLLTESTDIDNAWGPLPANTDCWLFWDINPLTGERTFGHTTIPPIASPTQPSAVTAGQMWFDTATTTMYVFTSPGTKRVAIRVFAAKVNNNTFTPLGTGISSKPYAGTQVGLGNVDVAIGRIIADDTGTPIRRPNGTLFTTEDDFFVDSSPVNVVRIDATVVNGEALEPMAKFQVVKFTEFGKIELAGYNDIQTTAIAMLLEDLTIQSVGTVCIQGKIVNPDWNWTTVGAELWIAENGLLTEVDPHVANAFVFPIPKPPVGRVLTSDSIIFDQGLGGKGERGSPGLSGGVSLATTVVHGVARLSVPAATTDDPVVVGTNDPRLTDKVFRSGDTMTGPLLLNADPTQPLGAAPKQYVDSRTLDNLADVATTGAVTSNVLVFNGTNWVAGAVPSSGATILNDLTDVTLASISSGDHLVYNGSQWVNQTPATPPPFPDIPEVLNDLTNVNTTGAITGDALVFNGTNWVPGALPSVEGDDNVFVFQVGTVTETAHIHFTPLTSAQVQLLVDGTDPTVAVGSAGQPSVTVTSTPNANPGDADHTHEITVVYDYVTQSFEVTDISNNSLDNHETLLIGKAVSGGSGDSLWEEMTHEYPSRIVNAVAKVEITTDSHSTVDQFLSTIMYLNAPEPTPFVVTLIVDGVRRTASVTGTNTTTVQAMINQINATSLSDYVTVSAEFSEEYRSNIVYTAVEGVTSLSIINNAAFQGDPFLFSASSWENWYGYEIPTPTPGEYFVKSTEALAPIMTSEPIQEVYLPVNTYVDSNPIEPLTYNYWTSTLAHTGATSNLRINAVGGAIGTPGSSTSPTPYPTLYTGANLDTVRVNNYGALTTMIYLEGRHITGSTTGGVFAFQEAGSESNARIGLIEGQSPFSDTRVELSDIDVGNSTGNVYILARTFNTGGSHDRMVLASIFPTLNGVSEQTVFSHGAGDIDTEGSISGRIAVNRNNNFVAAAWSYVNWDEAGRSGVVVVLQDMTESANTNVWTTTSLISANNLGMTDIAVDQATGDVLVMVSCYYNYRQTYIARFAAATGALIWEQYFEDPTYSSLFTGFAIDEGTGNIFVGGTYYPENTSTAYAGLLMCLNGAGVRQWVATVGTSGQNGSLYSRANNRVRVAVDANSVYLSYAVDQNILINHATDLWIGAFEKATPVLKWQAQVGSNTPQFYSQYDYEYGEGAGQGDMSVNNGIMALSFTTFAGHPGYLDIYHPRKAIVTLDVNNISFGVNPAGYAVRECNAVVANGDTIVPAPAVTARWVPNIATNPTNEVMFSLVEDSDWREDLTSDLRVPSVGVEIPAIEPSLEVANNFKAGALMVGDLLPPPATLIGDIRDIRGMIRFGEEGIWYCFANYNGVTDVWKFVPFDRGAKVFTYNDQSITALPIHINNIVLLYSSGSVEYRIPENTSAFPIGTTIVLGQYGSGQVSVVAENSYNTQIYSPETNRTRKQHAKITLFKITENEWHLEGNLEVESLTPPGGVG